MIKIKETLKREVLSEGRSSGMGFALLKKIDEKNYETVNPVSPCKDYLSEVVFTEHTSMSTKAHGLVYGKKLGILEEEVSYLVFTNMKNKNGTFSVESKSFEVYSKEIEDNFKGIEAFINKYQTGFKFKPCVIEKADNDQYLVTFDTRWANSTYSISLFTLLLRIAKDYKTGTALKYILKIPNKCIDFSLINTAFKKIMVVLDNKKVPTFPEAHVKARKASEQWSPHNYGICMWDEKY